MSGVKEEDTGTCFLCLPIENVLSFCCCCYRKSAKNDQFQEVNTVYVPPGGMSTGAYSSGYGGYGAPMPMPGLSYGPAYNTAQRSPPQASFNYIPHDSGYLQ